MKVAVTYENGEVFQQFDQTSHIRIYDVRGGAVLSSMVVEVLDCGHEALAQFLGSLRVSIVICGGIGGSARAALEEAGIVLYGGVTGSTDAAVDALLAGTLRYDPEIHRRSHAAGEGAPCAHSCGHDCGETTCTEQCAHHTHPVS